METVSYSSEADVILHVGQPPKEYRVEMEVLCEVSPVFTAAFTGGFREAIDKKMKLLEEDIDDFGRFLDWAYKDTYPLADLNWEGISDERVMQLARLYVLADKYDVVKLKHNVIDRIFEVGQWAAPTYGPPHDVIRYVFENTALSSLFRRFIVLWYFSTRTSRMFFSPNEVELERDVPELQDEITRELQSRGEMNPFRRIRSAFYESDGIGPSRSFTF